MATLTAKQRKGLPESQFVYPKQRKYPIHDRKHAMVAVLLASQKGTFGDKQKAKRAVCKKYPDMDMCKKKGK